MKIVVYLLLFYVSSSIFSDDTISIQQLECGEYEFVASIKSYNGISDIAHFYPHSTREFEAIVKGLDPRDEAVYQGREVVFRGKLVDQKNLKDRSIIEAKIQNILMSDDKRPPIKLLSSIPCSKN